MPDLVQLGKKLWSWISPPSIEMRIVTDILPSGQLDLQPEYWLGDQRLASSELQGRSRTSRSLKAG
jgi:hypothetical protein